MPRKEKEMVSKGVIEKEKGGREAGGRVPGSIKPWLGRQLPGGSKQVSLSGFCHPHLYNEWVKLEDF